MHVWKKSVSRDQVDLWRMRLAFLGEERLAVVENGKRKTADLLLYFPTSKPAQAIVAAFGGAVRHLRKANWQPKPGKPIRIAGRLTIIGDSKQQRTLGKTGPTLCIPAAMAFGSGEHATTAMCLRAIAHFARARRGRPWTLLDLGCGSGILALGACCLGAHHASGYDIDRDAVRIAHENAAVNRINSATFRCCDLTRHWKPIGSWDVVAANLFSESILTLLPQMRAAIAPGGRLILSGILADQAAAIVRAVRNLGLRTTIKRRGRWVMVQADPI